jgi:hypothetical protein
MLKSLKNAAIAASLGVVTLMTSTTAEARDRYGRYRGDNDAAVAIGAGVLGLAVGAAIASDRGDRYYRDRRYYRSYPRGYYYYDSYPRYRYREYYYRDYPRYRNDWRYDRRGWRDRDRYYRRGW